MLEELHVRDLALIEEVSLEFGPGMTALTGETGAGKTALVGALKLLVGERADSQLVRAGSQEALVEGRFAQDDVEIVARRRVSADGRSRCWIDGEMATVGSLADTMGPLFDLHGQHEHQALLTPSSHVSYLDRSIGSAAIEALQAFRDARAEHASLSEIRDSIARALAEDERKSDYLRFVVAEIEAVDPSSGEDDALERRMPGLKHGEQLTRAASEAFAALRADGAATDSMATAISALGRVEGIDPSLDALASRLQENALQVTELGSELRDYGEAVEHDPNAMNEVQARLATLATLKKKYGPSLDEVLDTLRDARERLSALDTGESGLQQAEADLEGARVALVAAAERLALVRSSAVEGFVTSLSLEVEGLAMKGARFDVSIEPLPFVEWTAEGPHRVEFMYAPGPDQPFRPLARIASGGEISRVMLALKSVLGAADEVPVLVFDEVDSGIGGATALAVGRRLARLATTHQVIVVTHLAQVAACADRHLVVTKSVDESGIRTGVTVLEGEQRVAEISRMLSGEDTPTARAHAEELLGIVADT